MSPSKTSNIVFDTFYNIVGGEQRSSKNVHHGVNPTTGEENWPCPIASRQDLDDAVDAANKAFTTWSQTTVEKRKELIQKLMELYTDYEQELIDLLVKETGKPVCNIDMIYPPNSIC
jgi:acyl-CoA reductase-like NAD-dependent aldehyde dehydrogenase